MMLPQTRGVKSVNIEIKAYTVITTGHRGSIVTNSRRCAIISDCLRLLIKSVQKGLIRVYPKMTLGRRTQRLWRGFLELEDVTMHGMNNGQYIIFADDVNNLIFVKVKCYIRHV